MRYKFQSSFDRLFKKMVPYKQKLVWEAIEKLKTFHETNQLPQGLGLKNLRKQYWEIRATLQDRVLFTIENDIICFILVGNHDDVRKFLKNQ